MNRDVVFYGGLFVMCVATGVHTLIDILLTIFPLWLCARSWK